MLVLRAPGGVLLQLRDDVPDIGHPGHWGLFGGGIEAGETPLDAARRELAEELGLDVAPERFEALGTWQPTADKTEHAFAIQLTAAELDNAVLAEGQAYGVWSAADVQQGTLAGRPVIPSHQTIMATF